ncbi:MAG: redoxin domain-containing protein [Nitrososphaerota archaeon]|jgi:peroxiredoxin|nr:redoxin domain-containing protein [Nitrososphaerota archaeon]MDG6942998.1 redoxin domain-containing protein [Nitrososphaerota archaeon]
MVVALRLGHRAPNFSLPDSDRTIRTLDEFIKDGAVILAFFPFAFSGVCDKEMCTFRDEFGGIKKAGAQVVGVSVDSVFSLKAFAQTYNLQFPLLSDFNKKVTRLYGVIQDTWGGFGYKGVSKRAVFVVDSRGILRYRWETETPSVEPPYAEVARVAQKQAA